VGANAAIGIAEGAKGGEYTSIENFQARTGANSAVIKALAEAGCLNGLPETDQLCLF
jgi:DNA polymerase III, alpha subunit, gram-positive type